MKYEEAAKIVRNVFKNIGDNEDGTFVDFGGTIVVAMNLAENEGALLAEVPNGNFTWAIELQNGEKITFEYKDSLFISKNKGTLKIGREYYGLDMVKDLWIDI